MKEFDLDFKLINLIEKECNLYDKRPKKERKEHPSGYCYMNDVLGVLEKIKEHERKKSKSIKKTIQASNGFKRVARRKAKV